MTHTIHPILLMVANCYLVHTETGFILVDTGLRADRGRLEKAIAAAGCRAGDLRLIVLTHGDTDHTGNAAYLRQKYGAPLAMHRADAGMPENGDMLLERRIGSAPMRFFMRLMHAIEKIHPTFERFTPDVHLEDGQSLQAYGLEASILHLPGHTPGSLAVLTAAGDLFLGDLLEGSAPPRPTFIVHDDAQMTASLARLKQYPIAAVYPGHGKPFPWAKYAHT